MTPSHFGRLLASLAIDYDLSHRGLGARIGLNQSNVTRICSGKLAASPEAARRIVRAFPKPKERRALIHAYIRDKLIDLDIPTNEMTVPLEPAKDAIANVADGGLYTLLFQIAQAISEGDEKLRTLVAAAAEARLGVANDDRPGRPERRSAASVILATPPALRAKSPSPLKRAGSRGM